jgi:solute carrier family 25 carnitine/acylcarnitine transporter 20/29
MIQNVESDLKSGLARAFVSHPFDNIKIQMQSYNYSLYKATHSIYKNQGLFGFYRGITPFAIGNVFLFSIYNNSWKYYKKDNGSFIAGSIGGLYGSILSNTMEYYRFKFINTKPIPSYILYKSYPITTFRDVLGWGGFYYTLDKSRKYIKTPEPFQSIIVGTLSGLTLWTLMYPIDTIKTRIQNNINPTILDIIKKVPLKNLWSGYSVCILRAIPVNSTIVYFIKE